MTELGARLKEARDRKGYSLDDLQEITKIQKRYLIGIEEGNFSNMPGSFYVRAFIKQYAEAVDLDPDELLEQYKRDIPTSQTEEVVQSYSTSHSRKKLSSTKNKALNEAMPKMIVGLFVVVIVAVIAVLVITKTNDAPPQEKADEKEFEYVPPKTTEPEEDADDAATGVDGEDKTGDEEEPTEPEVTQVISPGVVTGEDVTYEVTNAETLNIRVELSGTSWVGIRDENRKEKITARAYNAGEVVEYDSTADGYARIRLGAAANTKVFVNGMEVPKATDRVTQNFIIKLVKPEQ